MFTLIISLHVHLYLHHIQSSTVFNTEHEEMIVREPILPFSLHLFHHLCTLYISLSILSGYMLLLLLYINVHTLTRTFYSLLLTSITFITHHTHHTLILITQSHSSHSFSSHNHIHHTHHTHHTLTPSHPHTHHTLTLITHSYHILALNHHSMTRRWTIMARSLQLRHLIAQSNSSMFPMIKLHPWTR